MRWNVGSGGVDVAGAISPARANTLSLTSFNGAVTQAAGATITVPNLAASASTLVDLPAPNAVDNFAAQIMCCSAGTINFAAAAGRTVAIGSVDGTNGVTVNNFSGTGNVMLKADDLNIGSLVRVNLGNVALLPQTAGRAVTLGGNVAGTLSLDNTEMEVVPDRDFAEDFKKKTGAETLKIPVTPFARGTHPHMDNFLECVRTRQAPHLDADTGYRAMAAIGMGVTAYRRNEVLFFDSKRERVTETL